MSNTIIVLSVTTFSLLFVLLSREPAEDLLRTFDNNKSLVCETGFTSYAVINTSNYRYEEELRYFVNIKDAHDVINISNCYLD